MLKRAARSLRIEENGRLSYAPLVAAQRDDGILARGDAGGDQDGDVGQQHADDHQNDRARHGQRGVEYADAGAGSC